jgi:ornithine--oxo-acid transaminase
MTFSLTERIQARQHEQVAVHRQYVNPSFARAQAIVGLDKVYARAEGAYLWDVDENRYLDLLPGYSVINLGRGHPVIKHVLQELLPMDRPNLVEMDCPLLAGLLAEALVERMPPGLDAVFLSSSGADALDTALKFARAATVQRAASRSGSAPTR